MQKEQKDLQDSVMKCIGKRFHVYLENWIARHHFTLGLIERNGNNAIVVTKDDDAIIELHLLPGDNGKLKKTSTLLKR